MKNVGLLSMQNYENRVVGTIGSSRIRMDWMLPFWPEAEIFRDAYPYEVVIYQKAYHLQHAKTYDGIKILDLCDPDWLNQRPVMKMIVYMDAVTTSTPQLADYVSRMTDRPVLCIPDRINIRDFPTVKTHKGKAQTAVWFGYDSNHEVLDQCMLTLKRLNMRLTVLSNKPYVPTTSIHGIDRQWIDDNITNIKYDQKFFNGDLVRGDMVLNPRIESGRFQYKSNNKTLISWANGMPVATDAEEIQRLMGEDARTQAALDGRKEVEEKWNVEDSVKQYQDLIAQIRDARENRKDDSRGEQ